VEECFGPFVEVEELNLETAVEALKGDPKLPRGFSHSFGVQSSDGSGKCLAAFSLFVFNLSMATCPTTEPRKRGSPNV
jgi:hypothetical protein